MFVGIHIARDVGVYQVVDSTEMQSTRSRRTSDNQITCGREQLAAVGNSRVHLGADQALLCDEPFGGTRDS